MYSRSYNKNTPFTVPRQYSGVAFSRPRESEGAKIQPSPTKPPVTYSHEAGTRLYSPGDLPKVKVSLPPRDEREERAPERTEEWSSERAKEWGPEKIEERVSEDTEESALPVRPEKRPSLLTSLGSLGDDTIMLIALILLLSGCEDAGDTVILLILLLVLG